MSEEIRNKAFEGYRKDMKYKEITGKYGGRLSGVKSWAFWYWKKEGCNQSGKKLQLKKKKVAAKGTQPVNRNAVGHGGRGPPGNINAVKTGEFEALFFDTLEPEDYDFRAGASGDCPEGAGGQEQEIFRGMYEMINTIIESISIALNAAFGDRYELHREEVEQDLDEPCFFISCINSTNKLFLGKRYFRCNQFCIQYFPEDKVYKNKECNTVAERLLMCLKYLDVGGNLVMGTKMRYEVVDGILHFFVNYDLFVYKVAESVPVMEEVSSETLVKG